MNWTNKQCYTYQKERNLCTQCKQINFFIFFNHDSFVFFLLFNLMKRIKLIINIKAITKVKKHDAPFKSE